MEDSKHKEYYKATMLKSRFNKWNWIGILLVVLIYGTNLLLGQVNSFYLNYKQFQDYKQQNLITLNKHEHTDLTSISGKTPLTFAAVRNGTFVPDYNYIQWIQTPYSLTDDSGDYIVVKDNVYTLRSLKNPQSEQILFDMGNVIQFQGKSYKIETVTFSDDLNKALIICEKKQNWRHSFFATYFIYNVQNKSMIPLLEDEIKNENVALAQWSPDSNKIGFVYENNVYIKDVSNFKESFVTQVTFDGGAQIFYGKPDWVYEEEVFESDSALWWSPTSNHLLLLRSNDTSVPVYSIPYFAQSLDANESSSYPLFKDLKYPKAGFSNPIVDVLIYDIKEQNLKQLPSSDPFYNDDEISNDDRLITEVTWVGGENVLVRVTNRESDLMKIFVISNLIGNEEIKSIISRFEDARNTKEWFEITHNTLYIPKSESREEDGYIDVIGVDGYDHLAYFSPANATDPKYLLTQGNWEVVDGAAAFDYVNDKVYFMSTEKSSIERHLYSVHLNGTDKKSITNVSEDAWYGVSFSKGARYLLLNYEGPKIPYQKLLDLHSGDEQIFTNNNQLKEKIQEFDIPLTNFGQVELESGVTVNYKESLPLNFDPLKKYPLLFFVYGGPGSQLVQQSFSISFSSIIASELNAVVVTVDGRGTGFKGKEFRNIVHDNLGHYEVLDQVSAANHWINKGFIDSERTAIWGWSYGGYMTLKTLEYDQGSIFKYGMSVAPVTDWKLYDSIYTERYMHTPYANAQGYQNSKVHNAAGFKNVKKFLLMHGTGDDNVHFQNSLKFVDELDLAGIENYDMYVFPDSDHSIRWHNAGRVVYDRLFNWLKLAFEGGFDNESNLSTLSVETDYEFIDLYG